MKRKAKKLQSKTKSHPNRAAPEITETSPAIADWIGPLVIGIFTLIAFLPALQNEFVGWDDYHMLVNNPNYRGLGLTELKWMFTTFHMGHYQPLSWLTFALDYTLWGMKPFGYHLTNLLLHAANAILFYFLALRLLLLGFSISPNSVDFDIRTAAVFAALFFALHPLRVESVAWITERRDVLSGFFFLATILLYLRAGSMTQAKRSWFGRMIPVLIVYGLSLLSKASGMTLPIILLVLDVYPLRRLGGGAGKWFGPGARVIWLEKAPFFLLALGTGVLALNAQYDAGALEEFQQHGMFARLAQALFGASFYLWKTILPTHLSPLYERPAEINPLDWPFLLSGAIVIVITALLLFVRRRWSAGLAVWIFYITVLGPVLGIAQSGPQLVADRYAYLACLGWALLLGAGWLWCWRNFIGGRVGRRTFRMATGMVAFALVGLGVLTWRQTQVWHDTQTLWRHVLTESRNSFFQSGYAQHTFALFLVQRGDSAGAIAHLREALQINPHSAKVHNDLGIALQQQGKLDEAIYHYEEAVRIRSDSTVLNNLAGALAKKGQVEEAIRNFRQALLLSPDESEIHFNLGNVLVRQGQIEEAVKHFQTAVRIRPDFAEAFHNLGRVVAAQGQLDQAIDYFRMALSVKPGFAEAHESLGRALAEQGKREEAAKHYQEALRIMKSHSASVN